MLNTGILNILACPICEGPLVIASPDLITKIAAQAKNQDIKSLKQGLFCKKDNRIFLIQQGIPLLLADDSITLE